MFCFTKLRVLFDYGNAYNFLNAEGGLVSPKGGKALLSQMTQIFTDTHLYSYTSVKKLKEKYKV
ncbi:MAG: hypothetical protein IPJ45_17110 [Ignavibacteria bacterium]|nr:hypothetical protein [Ignavibacteria bacterium]